MCLRAPGRSEARRSDARHPLDDRLPEKVTESFFSRMSLLPIHTADRYVEPLREGGSLPAIVETPGGLYVVKFRGAGQGPRALVAELLVGELARELGLPVPGLALIDVAPDFGRSEPDPEIQDLLRASHGVNVGVEYLEGAFNFDPRAAGEYVAPDLAAEIVWLDAFVTNPDRTARNPNLMIRQRRPWLIDHGAALYHHHDWDRVDEARTTAPFRMIGDHVLLTLASGLREADERIAERVPPELFGQVVARVPDALISGQDRQRYVNWFSSRFERRQPMVEAAVSAQTAARASVPEPRSYRR